MLKKKISITLAILFCLTAIIFLTVCTSFGKNEKKLEMAKLENRISLSRGLNIGWQAKHGGLDFRGLEKFLASEQIQMVSFIGKNGTMYLTDIKGKEIGYDRKTDRQGIGQWCKINGTNLQEGCLKTNAHTITSANQMTLMNGHGSPEEMFIWVDGYMICWNFVKNRKCD